LITVSIASRNAPPASNTEAVGATGMAPTSNAQVVGATDLSPRNAIAVAVAMPPRDLSIDYEDLSDEAPQAMFV